MLKYKRWVEERQGAKGAGGRKKRSKKYRLMREFMNSSITSGHAREQAREFLLFAGAFTAVFFLIFLYFALISPPKITNRLDVEALFPTSAFQLKEGETYTYFQKSAGKKTNITYEVSSGFGCLPVVLSAQNLSMQVGCFNKKGQNIADSQAFTEGAIFEEWMLSLRGGWSWSRNITSYLEPIGIKSVVHYKYEVLSREQKFERDAYNVNVLVMPENRTYSLWIDAQKRVLLAMENGNSSIELATSNFLKRVE